MDSQPDLVERARTGDPDAFRALVDLWGDPLLRLGVVLTGDRTSALHALAEAFLRVWRELPGVHAKRAFRPWIIRVALDTLPGHEPAAPQGRVAGAIAVLEGDARVAAALHYGLGLTRTEIATVTGSVPRRAPMKAARAALAPIVGDAGDDAIRRALADELRGVEVPSMFFDDVLAERLARVPAASATRLLSAEPATVWAALTAPAGMRALHDAQDLRPEQPLAPRARYTGTGTLADRWRARLDVRAPLIDFGRTLSWITAAAPLLVNRIPVAAPVAIELVWQVALDDHERGTQVTLSLLAVAKPPIALLPGAKHLDDPGPWVHRALERFAAAVERRSSL